MSQCSSFCVFGLADGSKKGGDRGTDVITQKDRNRSGESNDTGYTIRTGLRCKILQNRDRCGTALYHKRHTGTKQNTKNRNMGNLSHHVYKKRTAGKWFHNTTHNFNSFKKQPERENNHTDIFNFFFFADKIQKKTDKNNRINIIADLKCHQLGRHGRTDIGTENNGNGLRKTHQTCTDKSDHHDGRGGAAL